MVRISLLFCVICVVVQAPRLFAAESASEPETLMCDRGELVFSDDFQKPLGKEWKAAKGDWKVENGVLTGAEREADQHGAVIRTPLHGRNFIIQYSFKLDGAKNTTLTINDPKGHNSRVLISKAGLVLRKDDHDHKGPDQAVTLQQIKAPIAANVWHTLVVEYNGSEMLARLDGKLTAYGSNDAIDVDKNNFGFTVAGESVEFRSVRVWAAKPKSNWSEEKSKVIHVSAK